MRGDVLRLCVVAILAAGGSLPTPAPAAELPRAAGAYVAADSLDSPHATQAAAADDKFVYAVSSTAVVKYDRASGKELAKSTGKAEHLNSAFLWEGRLYCA